MARSSSDPQAAMAEMLAQHGEQIGKLTADQQEVQRQFEQLRAIVDGLVQQDRRQQGYTPTPPPRWWQLEGADRDDAINTLHLWVDRVFRPCYERYADDLGPCWADHPLCLFLLDCCRSGTSTCTCATAGQPAT